MIRNKRHNVRGARVSRSSTIPVERLRESFTRCWWWTGRALTRVGLAARSLRID